MDIDSPNASNGSVTLWLELLKGGDKVAAQPIWNAYFARLVALARTRLRAAPKGAADEEDVALSAFDSFCRGTELGRFPRLDDRDDLWRILLVLTTRKAIGQVRHVVAAKRGGGRVASLDDIEGRSALLPGRDPAPDVVAEVTEECERLLKLLEPGRLRDVAVWKMEGFTNAEIAVKLRRATVTVERKLAAIREIWNREERA